jgi:hypothetical protein
MAVVFNFDNYCAGAAHMPAHMRAQIKLGQDKVGCADAKNRADRFLIDNFWQIFEKNFGKNSRKIKN